MGCRKLRTRDLKALAEQKLEQYDEAYDEAFNEEFRDFLSEFGSDDIIREDDIQGFLDSFTFPDEDEWAYEQVQADYDDYCDSKYQEWKDEQIKD